MKLSLAFVLLASFLSLNAFSASNEPTTSELKLRGCLSLAYSTAANFSGEKAASQYTLKFVSDEVKKCKAEARASSKGEKDIKRRAKLEEQIKKLQLKLSSTGTKTL